jgi:hypothetical protein
VGLVGNTHVTEAIGEVEWSHRIVYGETGEGQTTDFMRLISMELRRGRHRGE